MAFQVRRWPSTALPVPEQDTAVTFCGIGHVPKALKAGALAQLPPPEQGAEAPFPEVGPHVCQGINTLAPQESCKVCKGYKTGHAN